MLMHAGPEAHAAHEVLSPTLFTPLDPPETNVAFPNTPPSTGADHVQPSWHLPPGHPDIWPRHPLDDPDQPYLFRHSGWKHDRRRVYDALKRTGAGCNRLLAFLDCGAHPYIFQCVERPDEFAIGGTSCHDRFCLPCARDRSRVIATNVLDKIGDQQARFVTLTLRSTPQSLSVLLARLTSCFTKLRHTKLWRNKVVGGVAFLELTWNPTSATWHPHLHCLTQGRYLPRQELSQAWHRITGDSYITDIRMATDNAHVTHYITKYVSKPLDHSITMDPDRLDELVLALKGKRLCLTFGTWRGCCLTKPIEDGTWIQLGSLAELVQQASDGNLTTQVILRTLEIPFAITERGPPSPTASVANGTAMQQLKLNIDVEFTTWSGAN